MDAIKHDRACAVNTNAISAHPLITLVSDATIPATLGARLKQARTALGISQEALARAAGVKQSTIGNIEAGTRQRPRDLHAIAKAARVNEEWLRSGSGPRARGAADSSLSEDEADLVLAFRLLSEAQRRELLADVLNLVQTTTPFGTDVRRLLRERFGTDEIAPPERVAEKLPASPRALAVQERKAPYRARRAKRSRAT